MLFFMVFTVLHALYASWSSHNKAVPPYVCPSVKCIICDKTKESSAHILIPRERSFILFLWQEEQLVGATPSTWNFGWNWPPLGENADFNWYSLV